MRTHDHEQLKAATDAHLAKGSATLMPGTWRLDSSVYVDPAHLRDEQSGLFDRLPLVVAFSGELRGEHPCVSRVLAGTPVLIARQPDGSLRAYLDAEREAQGLVELSCVERHGLVWVARRPGVAIDETFFGPLDAELESMELGRFVVDRSVELAVDANWKLIMDGFLETYHVRFLHADTLTSFIHSDLAPFQALGHHSRHVVPRKSYDPTVHRSPADFLRNVLIEYTVFPNTNLMWAIDHFEVYQVEPDGDRVDRSRVRLTFLVDPDERHGRDQWEKNLEIARNIIVSEDFAAAQSIQRALQGGAAPAELVFGRNEAPLQHYHRQVAAVLADEPAAFR